VKITLEHLPIVLVFMLFGPLIWQENQQDEDFLLSAPASLTLYTSRM